MTLPVRLTRSPSLIRVSSPRSTAPDAVLLQVEHQPHDPVRELEHLGGHGVLQPVDAGDAVAHLEDRAHFLDVDLSLIVQDLGLEDGRYLLRTQLQLNPPTLP